jgi:hypothetical protein
MEAITQDVPKSQPYYLRVFFGFAFPVGAGAGSHGYAPMYLYLQLAVGHVTVPFLMIHELAL